MKASCYLLVSIIALYDGHCHAAFISTTDVPNVRFANAQRGAPYDFQALWLGVESGDQLALLYLGSYSTADVGKTFTFTPTQESAAKWEAVNNVLLSLKPTFSTMWLESFPPNIDLNIEPPSRNFLQPYRLQQVDITPQYIRRGRDDGGIFRTAGFYAKFYFLVPEPATLVLAIAATALLTFRHRRFAI